jgi:heme A synthase
MLFIQVILGGSYAILDSPPIIYHLVWGTLTFIVLIATTVLSRIYFGMSSTLFKVGLAAIVDFVIQGILGLISFGSGVALVVHLTNAFVLAILVTYLISFADTADRTPTKIGPPNTTASPGSLR